MLVAKRKYQLQENQDPQKEMNILDPKLKYITSICLDKVNLETQKQHHSSNKLVFVIPSIENVFTFLS